MKNDPEAEYLRIAEAAERAGVSVTMIHNWIADGLPSYTRRGVRGFLVRVDQLDAWLAPKPVEKAAR